MKQRALFAVLFATVPLRDARFFAPRALPSPDLQKGVHDLAETWVAKPPGALYTVDPESLKIEKDLQTGEEEKATLLRTVDAAGVEVACLDCDPTLFSEWVSQRAAKTGQKSKEQTSAEEEKTATFGPRHPNSPEYDEWKQKNKRSNSSNFLSLSRQSTLSNPSSQAMDMKQLSKKRPWLAGLWRERRLVLGGYSASITGKISFVDALVFYSREAPDLTPTKCNATSTSCGSLMTGEITASAAELRAAIEKSLGQAFLRRHAAEPDTDEETQKENVRQVLAALRNNYTFYHQSCITQGDVTTPGLRAYHCEAAAPSELLGRIACAPEEATVKSDCVYSELRKCTKCQQKRSSFFEFGRLHGAVGLLETKSRRGSVAGRCSEFSRLAHGVLAILGYEVRLIKDFTDHAWVEVNLNLPQNKKRWVHADPSEGVVDEPLMYEKGWGKKLTLIVALTPSSVEHVTRTYTQDYAATVKRRLIPENDLVAAITHANSRLHSELPMNPFGEQHLSSEPRSIDDVSMYSSPG